MHVDYLVAKIKIKRERWSKCQEIKKLYADNFIYFTLLSLSLFKIIYYTEGYTSWEKCILGKVGT
jgi:hypothetical protein